MKRRTIAFALLPVGAILALLGGFFVRPVLIFSYPTNARDNSDPLKRLEMVKLTLEWGRLKPFPETAKDFTIQTEGNLFTRTFRGSFSDARENIKLWLEASPGVAEGKRESPTTILLKTGEGAAYGEIILSSDGSHVTFRVSWS